jgi:hypothetical protein
MMVVPEPVIVSGTGTLDCPGPNVAVAGTAPTPVTVELRFTVIPDAGAGPDRVNVRVCEPAPVKVYVEGLKASVADTWAAPMAPVYPVAVAVMFADPRFTPVTVGC